MLFDADGVSLLFFVLILWLRLQFFIVVNMNFTLQDNNLRPQEIEDLFSTAPERYLLHLQKAKFVSFRLHKTSDYELQSLEGSSV